MKTMISPKEKLPEIVFVTSFPPRECGIATYSQDLINALTNKFDHSFECTVCALESDSEQHTYQEPPKYILNTDQQNSFVNVAFAITSNPNIHSVVIQHEFGFFANMENSFTLFFESISKPVVFVFHTVLPKPNPTLKSKVMEMALAATSIVVMTKNASKILTDDYEIPASKITVIPHGTHLVPHLDKKELKQKYHLTDKKVLTTFGLLSSGKGIEVTLDALPSIIKSHPKVMFLLLGKTHPSIVKNEGETYRNMLEQKVADLNLDNHVRFVNEYLPLPVLLEYLQLTDIYLFTSKDPNQAVSGTFSYALSCGCPIISTPIPQACEVLDCEEDIIVDFQDSGQLAEATIKLLGNEELCRKISLHGLQKMAATSWENSAIAHAALFESFKNGTLPLHYRLPEINLSHINKMTTDFGFVQFAKIAQPDLTSGYTLDDNARALIAMCQHYETSLHEKDLVLINIYFQFIEHCFLPDGTFLNYVDNHKKFTSQNYMENLEDSYGRVIWALGYIVSLNDILPLHFSERAEKILQKTLPEMDKIYSTRAMAFIIKGMFYQNNEDNFHVVKTMADRLVQMYRHVKKIDWFWFENYLTYGNSILSEALLCAYFCTHDKTYKNIAKESFDFLLSKIFVDDKIKVISNKGWFVKDAQVDEQVGGEQPIDVAYTILALEKFYYFLEKTEYKEKAITAFDWFLGKNHLQQIVYNPCTGGCYDGLEESNINLNQGAESTISYLLARLAMDRILSFEIEPSYQEDEFSYKQTMPMYV